MKLLGALSFLILMILLSFTPLRSIQAQEPAEIFPEVAEVGAEADANVDVVDDNPSFEKLTQGIPLVVDSHMHLLGMQTEKTGCYLNPIALSKWHPVHYIKSKILMTACGVKDMENADEQAWSRLSTLIKDFPQIPYIGLVFAFAATHNKDDQQINLKKTSFHVPNHAVLKFASQSKGVIPVGSIHPYQGNLAEEFQYLRDNNVKFLKILPNSMHFDPSDDACGGYFQKAEEHDMTVITHVGHEHSVSFAGINNDHGNPNLYKRWLDQFPKLKIIFAHVGSEGSSKVDGKKVDNFDLVMEILRDEKYKGRVFADISAFTSGPLRVKYLKKLILAKDVHHQLLFGSDYPLPAIKLTSLASIYKMKYDGVIDLKTKNFLLGLLDNHPLAFNFATMRSVAVDGQKLPESVFGENFKQISPDVAKIVESMTPTVPTALDEAPANR